MLERRPAGDCELRLQVAATAGSLRTVRLVAADAAERAGFDCDEIEDLRIAVDELCHAVMGATDGPILLGFAVGRRWVEVHSSAQRADGGRALAMSRLAELVVDCVSDRFELVDEPWTVGFVLVKRAVDPPSENN